MKDRAEEEIWKALENLPPRERGKVTRFLLSKIKRQATRLEVAKEAGKAFRNGGVVALAEYLLQVSDEEADFFS